MEQYLVDYLNDPYNYDPVPNETLVIKRILNYIISQLP